MYKVPFRLLVIMYTNGIGQLQRHWTPAFAGVTLFVAIAFKKLGLIIFERFSLLILYSIGWETPTPLDPGIRRGDVVWVGHFKNTRSEHF